MGKYITKKTSKAENPKKAFNPFEKAPILFENKFKITRKRTVSRNRLLFREVMARNLI